jgi:hypothetical protein
MSVSGIRTTQCFGGYNDVEWRVAHLSLPPRSNRTWEDSQANQSRPAIRRLTRIVMTVKMMTIVCRSKHHRCRSRCRRSTPPTDAVDRSSC